MQRVWSERLEDETADDGPGSQWPAAVRQTEELNQFIKIAADNAGVLQSINGEK